MFGDEDGMKLALNGNDSLKNPVKDPNQEMKLLNGDAEDYQPKQKVELKRTVGLIEGISLIVGIMIGSGIFASPRSVAKSSKSVGMSMLVWSGCGIIAIFGALSYLELGLMFQGSGAEKLYLTEAFGKEVGFLFTFTSVTILKTSSISAICYACGEYTMEAFMPGCGRSPENIMAVKLIAAFSIGSYDIS